MGAGGVPNRTIAIIEGRNGDLPVRGAKPNSRYDNCFYNRNFISVIHRYPFFRLFLAYCKQLSSLCAINSFTLFSAYTCNIPLVFFYTAFTISSNKSKYES